MTKIVFLFLLNNKNNLESIKKNAKKFSDYLIVVHDNINKFNQKNNVLRTPGNILDEGLNWIKENKTFDEVNVTYMGKNYTLDKKQMRKVMNLTNSSESNIVTIPKNIEDDNAYRFIIYTERHGVLQAKTIKEILLSFGFNSKIVFQITQEDVNNNNNKPNEIFFIFFPQTLRIFPSPNKYIIYQLEQYKQSPWVDEVYKQRMKNSLLTLEYSLENYNNFSTEIKSKLYYFPVPVPGGIYGKDDGDYKYDIIFCGSRNDRRNRILNFLRKKYRVFECHDKFNEELYDVLKKSKIALNLHFYKNAILETTRITELLFNNKVVISELPDKYDIFNQNFYSENIIFIDEIKDDLSNIDNLVKAIDLCLDETVHKELRIRNEKFMPKLNELSKYMFAKALQKANIIPENKIQLNYLAGERKLELMKEIVVLSSNIGSKNNTDISLFNDREIFDWFYFTDSSDHLPHGWEKIIQNSSNKNNAKNICKISSLEILNKYSYFIVLDSSVNIKNVNFVSKISELILDRDFDMFAYETNKPEECELYEKYRADGLNNENFYDNRFFICKNNDKIKNFFNDWKNEISTNEITNDGDIFLSFQFCLFKNGITPYLLNDKIVSEGTVDSNNLINVHQNKELENVRNIVKKLNIDEIDKLEFNGKKINGIDGIAWINLERNKDRKKIMENILDKIPTENFYIQAIDGKENAYISNTFKDSTLSKYEIANTLSHLKAINFLNQKEGNYFLILEDNISTKNAKLLEEDIERIIKYSPEFDILVLNQTYTKKIQQPSNYIKWNDYYVDENDYIKSTLAYIITKSAIQKIVETNKYIDDTNFEIENIDVADRFIYKKLNTYVYYLNYFGANSEQSTIHSQHLQLFRQNNLFHYKKILKDRFQIHC